MSTFTGLANNPNWLAEERARSCSPVGYLVSLNLQKCPCCKKRRSVTQFAKPGGQCKTCRGEKP